MSSDSSGIAGRTEWAASESDRIRWSAVRDSLTQPYRVTVSMVVLVSLVPLYIFIADAIPKRAVHMPALPLDRLCRFNPSGHWSMRRFICS